jgi:hypothetical protein
MVGEKECWFLSFAGLGGQDGVMASRVQTKYDLGSRWFFDVETLGANGHAAIGADLQEYAEAPDIIPPGTGGNRLQGGQVFLFGPAGSLAQFPVDFMSVVMRPQGVDVSIGHLDFRHFFTGEVGRQPPLPELVRGFDSLHML